MMYSFSRDAWIVAPLFDLLDTVFPGLRAGAERIRRLGVSWESVSTPFIHFEGDRARSHVGVIELPLVLGGRLVPVGSIHAVATHPDCLRRGYYRGLMEEVLQACAHRYETLLLTTEHPEYFEPFGFRRIQEHIFELPIRSPGVAGRLRRLDLRQSGDVALLHRLLDAREPVSRVVGVAGEKAIFCFNEGSRDLYYAADLDVILCLEMEEARMLLFDVVGPKLPTLDQLARVMPWQLERVVFFFSPDRFTAEAAATPHRLDHDGPSHLMVRGPFAAERLPFMLPRSART